VQAIKESILFGIYYHPAMVVNNRRKCHILCFLEYELNENKSNSVFVSYSALIFT
jgi:hypothetical protein